MAQTPDRIEKQVILNSPPVRVWEAISDAKEFGRWFGVDYSDGKFVEGEDVTGQITNPEYSHVTMTVTEERIVPGMLLSFRWRPYAIDPNKDYSDEPKTLVEFTIEPHGNGTLLKVSESGFDGIPAYRRDEAFRMNDGGWASQMEQIRKHVDG